MGGHGILLLLAVYCCAQYVIGLPSLSKDEDIELRKVLELHRKPVEAIIKTKYGEEYNCIDFYKQPAFDHPKLRNRRFEFKIRPSSTPSQDLWAAEIWVNGKGCPSGTVPIKRYTKNDLIKAIRIAKLHAFNLNISRDMSNNVANSGYHYAIAKKEGMDPVYGGIAMQTTIHNPRVQDNEYSSSKMRIYAGVDLIQTGWTVNPSLYHDHLTRHYIFTTMDKSSCFNDLCPGFVIDNSNIPLGRVYKGISVVGGQVYDARLTISREESSGNWVLKIGPKVSDRTIGYWPKDIFTTTGLGNLAAGVAWGGEVYSESSVEDLPQMGSGYPQFRLDTDYTACLRLLQVQDKSGQMINAPPDLVTFAEYPYRISTVENGGEYIQLNFYYGGPITSSAK